ncbi:MAG TPA: hypothetical protein VFV85_04395 [Conexibacter sp.]|nr:hypothetical protein [Conexibacter sp.]
MTIAVLAAATAAGTAHAGSFTISPAGGIEAFATQLRFLGNTGAHFECNVTLRGRLLAGPIAQTAGSVFGEVPAGTMGGCVGATSAELWSPGLPWRLKFQSGVGTWPSSLTGLLFTFEAMRVRVVGFAGTAECIYGGTPELLADMTNVALNRYRDVVWSFLSAQQLAFVGGSTSCPTQVEVVGAFRIAPTQTITAS